MSQVSVMAVHYPTALLQIGVQPHREILILQALPALWHNYVKMLILVLIPFNKMNHFLSIFAACFIILSDLHTGDLRPMNAGFHLMESWHKETGNGMDKVDAAALNEHLSHPVPGYCFSLCSLLCYIISIILYIPCLALVFLFLPICWMWHLNLMKYF